MTPSATTMILGYAGIVLLVLGTTAGLAVMVLDPRSELRVAWARYEAKLDAECRFLLMQQTGARIARLQLAGMLAVPILAFLLDDPIFLLLIPPVALAPWGSPFFCWPGAAGPRTPRARGGW